MGTVAPILIRKLVPDIIDKYNHCVGKETGETAHRERWNNTLRQRMSRYVRQTFSFSKSDAFHEAFTKWFIVEYNRGLSLTT
jgi:insertion element IS1 protein InsB